MCVCACAAIAKANVEAVVHVIVNGHRVVTLSLSIDCDIKKVVKFWFWAGIAYSHPPELPESHWCYLKTCSQLRHSDELQYHLFYSDHAARGYLLIS